MTTRMNVARNLTRPERARNAVELEAGLKEPVYDAIEIPEEFGPVQVLIDDLKIKRFAFVADDFGDWYLRDSPWGGRIAQPGLLANDLLQLFTTRYAPSQVVGLHTSEELWWTAPVRLGEVVALAGRYTEKYEQRDQGSVVMDAEVTDSAGRVVMRHRGVEIMRTRPGEVGGRGGAGASSGPRVTGEIDPALTPVRRVGVLAAPGTGLVALHKEVTFEQMAVFSRLGEFILNIHNDLRTARAAGLQLPIVQGQQQVCYLAELCARSFGVPWFTGGWLKVKFLRPIDALETIEVAGVVREVTVAPDPVAELDVWIRDRAGRLVTVGWARCALGPDAP